MCNTKPITTINKENQEIYVYNLKEILNKSDNFNPLVVFKIKNELLASNKVNKIINKIKDIFKTLIPSLLIRVVTSLLY